MCQQTTPTSQPAVPAGSSQAPSSVSGSWSAETFAPKISSATIAALKAQFLKDYPSEVLASDTMPSRLISQAHHNFKQNEIKWIPWKFRISVNKADEISAGRSSKVPKLEGLELHSLLMDVHNTALSLVGAAHLATLRAYSYSIKFLSLLSVKLEPETGLRPPTILEAQSADKHLWSVVSDVVQENSWSLDQALHELTYVRSDIHLAPSQTPPSKTQPPVERGQRWSNSISTVGTFRQIWEEGLVSQRRQRQEWNHMDYRGLCRRQTPSTLHALSDESVHFCRLQVSSCIRYAHFRVRGSGLRSETSGDAAQERTSLTRDDGGHLRIFNRCGFSFARIHSSGFTTSASGSTIIAAPCIVIFSSRTSDSQQYIAWSGFCKPSGGGHCSNSINHRFNEFFRRTKSAK